VPHVANAGVLHVAPLQHPVSHVVAQPLQTPPVQTSPAAQLVQAAPAVPHASGVSPGWQAVPAQHPFGQDVALHAHCPAAQCCPVAQMPLPPHVHTPWAEHPSASIALQATHAVPSVPHVASVEA
jgi:hypothetical protein